MPLIECITRREGGSIVELFGVEYHFKPAPGREAIPMAVHVCEVDDEDAAAILLAIPDFRLIDNPTARADSPALIAARAEAAAALAGKQAAQAAEAAEAARRHAAATTEVPPEFVPDAVAESFPVGGPRPEGASASLEEMDLEQLRAYAAMLGMKPHAQMGAPKLRANILLHLEAQFEADDAPT